MRYIVIDDDGFPLRKFWTREEAVAYAQQDYQIIVLPKPPAPSFDEFFAEIGEARW